jgi:glycosyltransferase involved in cell wall biosynthesis
VTALRFCHVTTFYPPYGFGGDAVDVQRWAHALARRGHDVTVVHDIDAFAALDHSGSPSQARAPAPTVGRAAAVAGDPAAHTPAVEPDGVRVIGLRSPVGALSPALTHQVGRPVVHGRRLRRLLADGAFDVVNFHNVSLVGGPGVLGYGDALKLYTAREHWLVCPTHVLWRHGREPCTGRQCLRCVASYHRPPQVWRYTGALERSLRHVDAFVALSEFSRAKHAEFGFTRAMEVIPSFAPDALAPDSGPGDTTSSPAPAPYFLFAGRLERLKGLGDVLPLFTDGRVDADLLVAGTGEHEAELRALAGDSPRVKFLGRVPADELVRLYAGAVAVVVPSIGYETFGVVIVEALRVGTPVVARRLGPFPEIVGDAGELFSTTGELQRVLTRLLDEPATRAAYAERAAARFRTFYCEDAVVPQYLELVARVAARTGRTRIVDALGVDGVGRCAPS